MPTITFVEADGTERTVVAAEGTSLMQAGVANDISGIVGECGGSRMCATCHVVLDLADLPRLPPISEGEEEMLEFGTSERFEGSRLGCQIPVTDALDGLKVRVPG
ncbi:2Fe-2S iron-sulfur cluster-binding protein [Jiella pacifica]|uniref:2Fe-2S iron-sulfur cluster binding domain-containing protein n=1 Tax=Jiella pacifica TaxID=2696469 RepID=A0A6N9T3E2_9HYPH|nr:2Fe-2S iron-sulfur cluster-binding protein [Jiella pacifica]NDW05897.1 2Fe-2S iron-sulfur cluster binding domain-containing protein [Jiella pacifica]